jgi:hypothetical protein
MSDVVVIAQFAEGISTAFHGTVRTDCSTTFGALGYRRLTARRSRRYLIRIRFGRNGFILETARKVVPSRVEVASAERLRSSRKRCGSRWKRPHSSGHNHINRRSSSTNEPLHNFTILILAQWIRVESNGTGSEPDLRLTATGWLCLANRCGRVVECHLPHAAMSAGGHPRLPRLPTKEELLHATLQLPFPASTVQSLSVSRLRKRPS